MKLADHHDTVVLPVPAGLRLRSAADRRAIEGGINLFAQPLAGPKRLVTFRILPSGFWVAHSLPGVPHDVMALPSGWPVSAIAYRFLADDPGGRFLPLRFTSPLPDRGALNWSGWAGWTGSKRHRAAPILPPGAGAATLPEYVPLFPGPGWLTQPGLADVRAQLAIRETGGALRNAGWTIVTVGDSSSVFGLGVADGEGRLVVAFPYPAMPPQTPLEATQGRARIEWKVRLRFYCSELGAGLQPGETPELQDILAQLDHPPIKAMATILGSQPQLPDQSLILGESLVLRTATGSGSNSTLFLKSP